MKKVLLVGHCGPDTMRIARVLEKLGLTYEGVFNHEGGMDKIRQEQFDLVLPNRVFGNNDSGGVDFIKAMKADEKLQDIPVILVSGITTAQANATAAGACEGFGKDDLETGIAAERIRSALI